MKTLALGKGGTWKGAVAAHREALAMRLGAGDDGISLGRANAAFLEEMATSCFREAVVSTQLGIAPDGRPGASKSDDRSPEGAVDVPHVRGIALAAVGSFGRGAVALRSDADLVLVVDPRVVDTKRATAFAEALLYPMWDATVQVGHQVMSAADAIPLAQKDLATATALLDLRFLAGDEALVNDLMRRAGDGLFAEEELAGFMARLEEEASGRHARFGGSVYLLEPDVKSGAGGLRDVDGARWAARARYRVGDARDGLAGAAAWGKLVQLGVLVGREAREIAAAEEYLWRVRNRLHARAGRKADRLGFEEQEAVAMAMGYGEDRARSAERLMQDYYIYARTVTRARESVFERLRDLLPRRRRGKVVTSDLGGGVHVFDGQVTIAGTAELSKDPALALRLFAACVRTGAPVLPFARDAVGRAAADPEWCERLRASPEAASLFVEQACTVQETRTRRGSILEELHAVGLLLAMVPEFLPVTGRVHHDVYHVYTVDVHSVAAVDRLRQLARGEIAQDFPLSSQLAAEIALPRPLFLATLLHDVGKGWPDASGSRKNHSKTGADLCRRILPRLGLSDEEVDEACELVADHLLMYHVATRRDLDDPATIEEFCRNVRGKEGLRNLYLLTVSDLSTTSPTAMTSWKARMLDELYYAAQAHLEGQPPRVDAERVARVREAARQAWPEGGAALEAFVGSMPERYLLSNAPASIVEHARVALARGDRSAYAARVPGRHPEAAELCVVALDRPGLLADIAAAITANRLEVLAAQVYSRKGPAGVEAVDLFWVRDRDGGTAGVEAALARLGRDLEELCAGRTTGAALLGARVGAASPWRERPSPAVPTEVQVDSRSSPRHTVVEVFARDRPGLLFTLAEALHELGLSIALSKINTEGTRVADVFYVNELDGAKVSLGPRSQQIHEALLRAVG